MTRPTGKLLDKAPRRKRQPSERNLQIYEQVRMLGQSQTAVAQRHGLSQRRVSQICQQTDRWRGQPTVRADGQQSAGESRQANRLLVRRRYEQLYVMAVRQMLREREALVTERRVERDGKTTVQRTSQRLPVNPQWLKIAGNASRQIAKLDREIEAAGAGQASTVARELDDAVAKLLGEISDETNAERQAAATHNRLAKAEPLNSSTTSSPAARSVPDRGSYQPT
ncbi:MAG: hypothetical protein WD872_03495 [Pirellulaceae bacterium]